MSTKEEEERAFEAGDDRWWLPCHQTGHGAGVEVWPDSEVSNALDGSSVVTEDSTLRIWFCSPDDFARLKEAQVKYDPKHATIRPRISTTDFQCCAIHDFFFGSSSFITGDPFGLLAKDAFFLS